MEDMKEMDGIKVVMKAKSQTSHKRSMDSSDGSGGRTADDLLFSATDSAAVLNTNRPAKQSSYSIEY